MPTNFITDQTFLNRDFTKAGLPPGKYDNCHFEYCHFGGVALDGQEFTDCTFLNCDLTGATIRETGFKTVNFRDCKLLALKFEDCRDFLFAVHCRDSTLDYCSFAGVDLQRSTFHRCLLREADFSAASLQKLSLDACDLSRATFQNTALEGTDFSSAINFDIDPRNNQMRGAIFARKDLAGLLTVFGISVR